MTVRVYRSSDASAPVLRGNTPGDLINVLDKCLVTGYGSQTAAGWTKPYTGTNLAAFRQGAGSNGMYIRVDDTSSASGNRAARVVGYEAMSDVNTGTPQSFPTSAQSSGGGYIWTNYTSSTPANARPWIIIADEKAFYLLINNYPEKTTQEYNNGFYFFGDINTYKTGDATHTVIITDPSVSAPWTSQSRFSASGSTLASAESSMWIARRFDQLGAPVPMGWHSDYHKMTGSFCNGTMSYPHGPDGGLYMAPIWCHDPNSSPYNVRGTFPGLWAHCHATTIFNHLDTFNGQGDLAGKTFLVYRGGSTTAIIIETSDTWR